MVLCLGLDSGGTKTLAAIADERGCVLRFAAAESLDPLTVPDWRRRLTRIVTELTAGLQAPIAAAVLGLPRHGEIAAVDAAQRDVVATLFDCEALIENDVRIAFDGAFAGAGGALVLAGTGSMVWASRGGPDAEQIRTGGWGEVFGDEGSAYWIGREALGRLSQELDGRAPRSAFSTDLMARIGVTEAGLMDWLYRQDNPRQAIAALARPVGEMAEAGDAVATALLDSAADCLATAARAAWRRTGAPGPLCWSHAGGLFQSAILRAGLAQRLDCAAQPALLPPVGGALLRAAQMLRVATDAQWVSRLSSELDAKQHQPIPTGD